MNKWSQIIEWWFHKNTSLSLVDKLQTLSWNNMDEIMFHDMHIYKHFNADQDFMDKVRLAGFITVGQCTRQIISTKWRRLFDQNLINTNVDQNKKDDWSSGDQCKGKKRWGNSGQSRTEEGGSGCQHWLEWSNITDGRGSHLLPGKVTFTTWKIFQEKNQNQPHGSICFISGRNLSQWVTKLSWDLGQKPVK